jgi:hypothetical protein
MKDAPVPFFANPDDRHCHHACIRMALKHFIPSQEFSWQELEKICDTGISGTTWPLASLTWLARNGFVIKDIELYDYKRFVADGAKYMKTISTKEVSDWQIEESEILKEQANAKKFLEIIAPEKRTPTLQDIHQLLDAGYLIICEVNWCSLNNEEGFEGHYVLIKGYGDKSLIVHDPGLPAHENWRFSNNEFEEAWSYSSPRYRSLIGIKKAL